MAQIELVRGLSGPSHENYRLNGGYTEDPDTFHIHYVPESEPAADAIIRAVSLVHNVDFTELEPLEMVIDTDALNALMQSTRDTSQSPIQLSFEYEGLSITLNNEGDIWLKWN